MFWFEAGTKQVFKHPITSAEKLTGTFGEQGLQFIDGSSPGEQVQTVSVSGFKSKSEQGLTIKNNLQIFQIRHVVTNVSKQ